MQVRLLLSLFIAALLVTSARGSDGTKYIIVKLKPGQSVRRINNENGTQTVRHIPNTNIYLIRTDEDEGKILRKLRKDAGVEDAEVDRKFRLTSARDKVRLNAGLVQEMMSMLDGRTLTNFNGSTVLKAYAVQTAVARIQADTARKLSTGAGTRVGFMDTGVDFHHPALRPWLDPGVNVLSGGTASEMDGLSQEMLSLLDQEGWSMLDPEMVAMLDGRSARFLGHGTLVAGLIHLVAPDARLVPIKAFDANGYTTIFTIISGIYWASDQNLDVLNLSFSTSENSDLLRKSIDDARTAGTVVVASAGNDAYDGRDIYPAGWGNVIGVAATDLNDRLANFSNYGKSVSVTAPGAFVISTFPGGKYAVVWGTSFSAPLVSGSIALIASLRGFGQSDATAVITTADPIDGLNPGFERKLGRGRINVQRALRTKN